MESAMFWAVNTLRPDVQSQPNSQVHYNVVSSYQLPFLADLKARQKMSALEEKVVADQQKEADTSKDSEELSQCSNYDTPGKVSEAVSEA